ncbi:MAG: putative cation-transporting ATPase F [Desulfovibrio sp.]
MREDATTVQNWHTRSVRETLEILDTDPEIGLASSVAGERLESIGPNRLPEPQKQSELRKFLRHFHDLLIYILIFGAFVTAFMGHYIDTVAIAIVVVINAIIGYVQENKAENALAGIRGMLALQAHVVRDGLRNDIDADTLTLGDIVRLKPGDKVPADLRLLRTANLRVEEAALTGEAVPAEKDPAPLPEDTPLGDRANMAYSGTTVSAGTGLGVVAAVGQLTEVGKINRLMAEIEPLETPLLRQITAFSKTVAMIILGISAVVFAAGYWIGNYSTDMLLLSVIALAIGSIPEGLPAVVSIILALGVQSMASRKAIVRNLPSVETLGSVSVICSDKTGTLTKNEMTVTGLATKNAEYAVSGTGYEPVGDISRDGKRVEPGTDTALTNLLTCFKVCNEAELVQDADGRWAVKGEPTEGALKTVWEKSGLQLDRAASFHREVIPFDSAYKYMAVLVDAADETRVLIKGAPEKVLAMCDGADAEYWLGKVDAFAVEGMRTLAAAWKKMPSGFTGLDHANLESGAEFLGLAGIVDPPREEAVAAVKECAEAGIEVKMITGDHAATARAIGKQLGIGDGTYSVEGKDIDAMTDEELRHAAKTCRIFARTSPEHKLRLVEALQAEGVICAMTGDGVNDAPALRKADIGIAMGIKGTEVTKEAAEIVLADDNFQTIAAAVEEGRKVYDNLRKTLLFILPTNLAEGILITVGILFGSVMLLTPVQVLWINLVTAVTISLALAFEPLEPEAMQRPPRNPEESLLYGYYLFRLIYVGVIMGGACLVIAYGVLDMAAVPLDVFRTIIVQTIVVCEVFYMFNIRNMSAPFTRNFFSNKVAFMVVAILVVLQLAITYVPFLSGALGTAPMTAEQWTWPFVTAVILFIVVEIEKLVVRRMKAAK